MYYDEPIAYEDIYDDWWQQQDQDEEWIANQQQADKQIFRDQCKSMVENYESLRELLIFYWSEGEWDRAHAALSAVVMTTPDFDLMMECATLSSLVAWRMS